jgi:hypothetical protein
MMHLPSHYLPRGLVKKFIDQKNLIDKKSLEPNREHNKKNPRKTNYSNVAWIGFLKKIKQWYQNLSSVYVKITKNMPHSIKNTMISRHRKKRNNRLFCAS